MNGDILQAVDSYNPEKDAVFLLEYRNQVAFCYLTNLPITPPQCFQTVRKQLVEFQSTFKSFQA